MLVTSTQLKAISVIQEKKFIQMLAVEVTERFKPINLTQIRLLNDISEFVKEAHRFEFNYDDDIEQFVYLKFLYPSFAKLPHSESVIEILTTPDRHPEIKINELIHYFENR